jgi:uncharacterized membrane protein YqaE (UPF0057 family)
MKKIVFGLLIVLIGSLIVTSCSSDRDVLSQFSKRKYLKNFKKEKGKDKDNINDYQYAAATTPDEDSYIASNDKVVVEDADETKITETPIPKKEKTVRLRLKNTISTTASALKNYNATMNIADINFVETDMHNSDIKENQVDDVVLIILCIFLPPLAVYLFDGSITTNFWVDLILSLFFWLPGIIFAILVCFGGVSL